MIRLLKYLVILKNKTLEYVIYLVLVISLLIQPDYKVIVVSRHYLGSINHTLLTLNMLKEKGFHMSLIRQDIKMI